MAAGRRLLLLAAWLALAAPLAARDSRGCDRLTDCTPRIGVVSAFGAEADLLIAETAAPTCCPAGASPPGCCAATRW